MIGSKFFSIFLEVIEDLCKLYGQLRYIIVEHHAFAIIGKLLIRKPGAVYDDRSAVKAFLNRCRKGIGKLSM